jgi:hypothetical protein
MSESSDEDSNFDADEEDEEIDEDLAFTAEDEAKYGSWFDDSEGASGEDDGEFEGESDLEGGGMDEDMQDAEGRAPGAGSADLDADAWLAESAEEAGMYLSKTTRCMNLWFKYASATRLRCICSTGD